MKEEHRGFLFIVLGLFVFALGVNTEGNDLFGISSLSLSLVFLSHLFLLSPFVAYKIPEVRLVCKEVLRA